MRISKTGIILFIINVAITTALLLVPYIKFFPQGHERLVDMLVSIDTWWLSLTPFTSIIFIIEATIISRIKTRGHRLLFLFQSIVFLFCLYLTYVGMTLQFKSHYFMISYYIILFHGFIAVIWSVLLGLPTLDNNKIINGTYQSLSLIK